MMKKTLALGMAIVMILCVFAACGQQTTTTTPDTTTTQPSSGSDTTTPSDTSTTTGDTTGDAAATEPAEEMTYTALYGSEVSTLNYLITGTTWDQQAGAMCVDSLVEYDSFGNLIPGLAETWEVSEDGLTWTFHLRQGVKWYDYQGNEVAELTAQDFVDSIKYVCTAEYDSSTFYQVEIIEGATDYYDGTITDFSQVGVKAIDNYTLEYKLNAVTPYFLSCLTYVCYLPAYGPYLEQYGAEFATTNDKMLFCGAYIMSEFEPQVKHTYIKNVNNWDADKVYITQINRIYNAESATLAPTMALRGEVDYALISNDIIDEWKANYSDYLSMDRVVPDYSYFYCFNFDPQYDAEYEPENWRIAVNNENFRHSIMYGFNRLYSMISLAPDNAADLAQSTVTPATFCSANGVDFTEYPAFDGIDEYFYDEAKAAEYKAAAIEELTAAGATFPIKMVLTYKSGDSDWENEYILLKQQIEELLGTDYIECVLYAGPSESFLSATRRAGVYSFMRCNWGADYMDPQTWTDPFAAKFDDETQTYTGNSYNKMDVMLNAEDGNETKALLVEYYAMVEAAKAITDDDAARYTAFAEAEAFLIKHAMVIPYYISDAGYQATKINIFEGQYASFGVSTLRFKGQKVLDHFITPGEYAENYLTWLEGMAG